MNEQKLKTKPLEMLEKMMNLRIVRKYKLMLKNKDVKEINDEIELIDKWIKLKV